MPARFYIEPKLNCVFVQHFDEYTLSDSHDQLLEMLEDPDYVRGMNILRDIRATPIPSELTFSYFKKVHPSEMGNVERQLGQCKVAVLVGSREDYAIAHQLSISTRLTPTNVERKPFRDLTKAKLWLGVPEGYVISGFEAEPVENNSAP